MTSTGEKAGRAAVNRLVVGSSPTSGVFVQTGFLGFGETRFEFESAIRLGSDLPSSDGSGVLSDV